MSQREGQAERLQQLQDEIDAVQAEIAPTRNELVQLEASNAVEEAEIAAERNKVVRMQIGIIMQGTEAQA